MSFRTILVGLMAAVCGVSATAGVMMMMSNRPAVTPVEKRSATSIVVAKVNLDIGQKIQANMVTTMEWFGESLPAKAINDVEQVLDKYVLTSISQGDLVLAEKIGDTVTTLLPADGMRAFAIDAKQVSTNVGRNLVTGNRVDIVWQTSGKLEKDLDPVSIFLLQNVKVLAVSESQGAGDFGNRSVTLEVTPRMVQDLAFSQTFGTLSLSIRNPNDDEGVDPIETVNFSNLLAQYRAESMKQAKPSEPELSAWETVLRTITQRLDGIENRLSRPEPELPAARLAISRIEKGMRAITIQTPTESAGLAGLLEAGDRVDLHLTLSDRHTQVSQATRRGRESAIPTETLIENIEVLAVDTNLMASEHDGERNMSRSVTLIVKEEMQQDIARAERLGSLTLTLRGFQDREPGPPRTVLTVNDFVARYLPNSENAVVREATTPRIRTYRGHSVQEVQFAVSHPTGF